jgi:hypothetical protein
MSKKLEKYLLEQRASMDVESPDDAVDLGRDPQGIAPGRDPPGQATQADQDPEHCSSYHHPM